MVATSWLVYRLTRESQPEHAALMLGVVNFAAQIPIFLLAPLAGVWLDRWNRHHVLVATQSLSMLQSFAMAYLVLSGRITLTQIITLSVLQGIVNALDIPTRQSFIVQMIDRPEDLSNAIALNSSIVQASRLVGPAVAGFLIYAFGEGLCFLIDGFSFLAVLERDWRCGSHHGRRGKNICPLPPPCGKAWCMPLALPRFAHCC